MNPKDRFFIAVDRFEKKSEALMFMLLVSPFADGFKFGHGAIARQFAGALARSARKKKKKVGWDQKFGDTPETTEDGVLGALTHKPNFFTVHASAGKESLKRAAAVPRGDAKLFVVTVLTSISNDECVSIFGEGTENKVRQFTEWAIEVGAEGVICSPRELRILASIPEYEKIEKGTPGIHLPWADKHGQERTMSVAEAAELADFIVVGHAIRDARMYGRTPQSVAEEILKEITRVRPK
ncbi:MAG: orotidine 5'-phosphate decarboxylase / HUMPS family protein [bacterium]|nr:orotidine 5'-phosphate decarboxylase / HUMPS family protein [bacterium]